MLSGYVDIYLNSDPDVSSQNNKDRHSLRKTLESQKLIVIAPTIKYQIDKGHEYYMMIQNSGDIPASLVLTADKNDVPSPIFPGIRKMARLAPGENTNFYYTPNPRD